MSSPEQAHDGGRDPLIGRQLDSRYELLRRLGRGGMSTVYAARHLLLGKDVAVKVLKEELAHDPRVVEMIFREARTVARLGHPNIVDAIDVGLTSDGLAYIVLELLQGCSLGIEIARCHRIEPQRAVRLAVQVASAMTAAHGAGVVHRDLKPDNVFLVDRPDTPDHCKVLDFGVAKHGTQMLHGGTLTSLGGVVGTPGYMAPEQLLTPEIADHRVDIYALGVVLFEMLSGRPPYADVVSLTELVGRVQQAGAPKLRDVPLPLPEDLCDIVDLAMARNPDDRFQSMADFGRSLRSYAVATGVFAESPWLQLQGVTPPPIYVPSQSRPGLVVGGHAAAVSFGAAPATESVMRETSFAALPAVAPASAVAVAAPTATSEVSARARFFLAAGAVILLGLGGGLLLRSQRSPRPLDPTRTATPSTTAAATMATAAAVAAAAATAVAPAAAPTLTPATPAPGLRPSSTQLPVVEVAVVAERHGTSTRGSSNPPATRRSGGRGSALARAPSLTPATPPAAVAPAAESSKPPPSPAPAPAPAPVATAAPTSATPAPLNAPSPAPAPVAARAAVLAPAIIQKQVAAHRSDIDACVAEDPAVAGRLVLRLAVRADGSVEWARAVSGGTPTVRTCVTRHASSWRFPASAARAEGGYAIELD